MSGAEFLTGILAEIADVAGEGAALQLAKSYGGLYFEIPTRAAGSRLAEIVGEDAAIKIIAQIGPGRILVPQGPVKGEAGRRETIRRVLNDSGSAQEAARAADVHIRTVFRVKADMAGGGPDTLPLFGD